MRALVTGAAGFIGTNFVRQTLAYERMYGGRLAGSTAAPREPGA